MTFVKTKDLEKPYWIDNWMFNNLQIIKKQVIENKWDSVALYFGKEGTGKSTVAVQHAKYLDPEFSVDQIAMTPKEFIRLCKESSKKKVILWDEAATGAMSIDRRKIQKTILKHLIMIRKKGLKILLCLPYLDNFKGYFIKRCLYGINVTAKGFSKRGYGKFFSHNKLTNIYHKMKGKYRNNYTYALQKVSCSMTFRFNSDFPIDKKAYDKKKDNAIKKLEKQKKKEKNKLICNHQGHILSRKNKKTGKTEWYCRKCRKKWDSSPFDEVK